MNNNPYIYKVEYESHPPPPKKKSFRTYDLLYLLLKYVLNDGTWVRNDWVRNDFGYEMTDTKH